MNEEQNLNKSTKKAWNIADVIGWLLLVQGIIMCQNSMIWVLTGDDTDKWFSRASIGLICFGFAGIIFRLRKQLAYNVDAMKSSGNRRANLSNEIKVK